MMQLASNSFQEFTGRGIHQLQANCNSIRFINKTDVNITINDSFTLEPGESLSLENFPYITDITLYKMAIPAAYTAGKLVVIRKTLTDTEK